MKHETEKRSVQHNIFFFKKKYNMKTKNKKHQQIQYV